MKKNYLKLSLLSISAFLLSANLNTAKAQLNFAPAVDYSTGNSPYSVVSADFNGDGKMDIATANYNTNDFSVLLNNGNGTFATAVNYATDAGPYSLCATDLNEDGYMDLAISNLSSGFISIHLNQGNGTFVFDIHFSAGWGNPISIVASDFNNDGHDDIVVTNNINEIIINFGNGSGGFSAVHSYPVNLGPEGIFAADFNNDGLKDIVTTTASYDSLSVLLNLGASSFSSPVNYGISSSSFSVISADFNADSKMDLVSANYNAQEVSVLLGNGDGTFTTAVNYATASQPGALTFADFDGDNKLDIVTCNESEVSILLGSGLGTFAAPVNFAISSYSSYLVTEDFNADGKMDIATTMNNTNNVAILLNTSLPPAGAALHFDGLDDYVDVDYFSPTTNLTIEFNIKTTGTQYGDIITWAGNTGNSLEVLTNNGGITFGYWDGSTWDTLGTASLINDNVWHHVAVVRDSASAISKIYIDGMLKVSGAFPVAVLPTDKLTLGAENWLGSMDRFMSPGSLDEVRIWNRALCKGEILYNMNSEIITQQFGLVGYYQFNQGYDNTNNGSVTTLADSTGNGYDGTLNNFALTGATSNWTDSGAVASGILINQYPQLGGGPYQTTNVSCNGGNNGSVDVFIGGGTPAYTYAWSNGATTESVSGLTAGNYTLNVTDAQTCKATWTVTITEPSALDVSTSINSITITANATGVTYQWIDCNNANTAIAGETNQSFTATANGNYAVIITSGSCSDTSACVAITTVGIKSNTKNASVSIYPNPTAGLLNVQLDGEANEKLKVKIVNTLGQVVETRTENGNTLISFDLSSYASGMYQVIIEGKNAQQHEKIVVSR